MLTLLIKNSEKTIVYKQHEDIFLTGNRLLGYWPD